MLITLQYKGFIVALFLFYLTITSILRFWN